MRDNRIAIGQANCQRFLESAPWTLIAIGVFIFLAPNVDLNINLQWHDGQRLAQLVLLGVVVLVVGIRVVFGAMSYATWSLLPSTVRAVFLSAFALGLCSCIGSPLMRWALIEWGMSLLLVLLMLSVAADCCAAGRRVDQYLVALFFATATAYVTTAGVVYLAMLMFAGTYGQVFDFREIYIGFSNIRFFGQFQTMLLPFLLLPAMWWGKKWWQRCLLWLPALSWWMLMIGGGTRGTWGGVLVGIGAVACCGGLAGWRWIRWQTAGFLGGAGFYLLFMLLIPGLLQQPTVHLHRTGEIMTMSLRDILWNKAIELAISHPWLGVGPMHFAYHVTDVGAHPHNIVLQWCSEWGIPASLLLTCVCALGAFNYARYVRAANKSAEGSDAIVRVSLLAALAGAGAQSMVDGVFVMPVSQTTLALLAGWAIAASLEIKSVRHVSRLGQSTFAVLLIVSVFVIAWGVNPEIRQLSDRERIYLSSKPEGTRLMPRFWAHGYIDP